MRILIRRRKRVLYDELPTRDQHWCLHLEGSYAPHDELASPDHLGKLWLFNNHGDRTLERDDHCDRGFTRWLLREHACRRSPRTWCVARRQGCSRRLLVDLATWADLDAVAWVQRYAVVTACRMLYTFETARVTSKPGALERAIRTLDPRWRPLLAQVRDDRALGRRPHGRPRPGEADAARAFIDHVVALVGELTGSRPPSR